MANKMADPSIKRVMLMMSDCELAADSGKMLGMIFGIKINATTERAVISKVAVVSIVLASFWASSLSFVRYAEKTGKNAAESAPAIKRLNSMSGIRKEAL